MTDRLRLLAAAVTLAATAPLLGLGPAQAGETGATRTITMKGVEPRADVFLAKGRVDPAYEKRIAVMQRRVEGKQKWQDWKRFRTNAQSRYRREIKALDRVGTVCYRVKIKASGRFETSFSTTSLCVRTRRA